jgi:hypothetical protein
MSRRHSGMIEEEPAQPEDEEIVEANDDSLRKILTVLIKLKYI